jgi:cytochrome c oxidase assembly protein subunit 15
MNTSVTKTYKILCVMIFGLVALGAAVRAMNAGLACPDWPLCFGDFIPDYHPQVYFEFIHRALAGVVAIISVYLNIKIIRGTQYEKSLKILAGFIIVLLMAQVVMGGLTVLMKLHEKIVAAHLGMGTAFFALSFWVYLTLKFKEHYPARRDEARRVRVQSFLLVAAVYGQIILGGLVASHYAALVCTDFPLCNGEFIPTLKGIIGMHVIHRLGAYTLSVIVIAYAVYVHMKIKCQEMIHWSRLAVSLLILQIVIGIANVIFYTPPIITVLHLAVGAALLGVSMGLARLSSFR